jgi:membrane fusion protein (multidrug efflux system)
MRVVPLPAVPVLAGVSTGIAGVEFEGAVVALERLQRWLDADVIPPGQRASVEVDAIGGREFKGKVDSIAGATGARFSLLPPENATGNFVKVVQRIPVKIILDPGQDPEHRLRPGMSVVPTVYTR